MLVPSRISVCSQKGDLCLVVKPVPDSTGFLKILVTESQGEIARRKVTWALESPQFADIVMELNLTWEHCITRGICIYIYTCEYLQVVVFVVYGSYRLQYGVSISDHLYMLHIVFLLHPQHLVLSINTSSKYICNHIPF